MSNGRATEHDATFETGLLASCLILPAMPIVVAIVAWLANAPIVALVLGGIGALVTGLFFDSSLRIESGTLSVRMMAFRGRSLRLDELSEAYSEPAAPSFWQAPALRLVDRNGLRLSVCLGWWRLESEFLARIATAVAASGARTEPEIRQILRRRPPGMYWAVAAPGRRRRTKTRPFTRRPIDRAVFWVGISCVLFGLAFATATVASKAGVGSFGLVPAAIVAFEAMVLGGIAMALARPPGARPWGTAGSWVFVGIAAISTLAALIVAFDGLGNPLPLDRSIARPIVLIGRTILTYGIVAELLWLIVTVLDALGHRIRSAGWMARWLR